MGSWCTTNSANWGTCRRTTGHFGLRSVLADENRNLTNPQKELLLWHNKLGVSMQHIQRLMKAANVVEPREREMVKGRIIVPKYNSAAICEISKC